MLPRRLYLRPEFWVALLVLLLGILRTLKQMNVDLTEMALLYWPAGFILLAILQLFSRRYRDPASFLLLLAVGAILLQKRVHFLPVEKLQEVWLNLLELIFVVISGGYNIFINTYYSGVLP